MCSIRIQNDSPLIDLDGRSGQKQCEKGAKKLNFCETTEIDMGA